MDGERDTTNATMIYANSLLHDMLLSHVDTDPYEGALITSLYRGMQNNNHGNSAPATEASIAHSSTEHSGRAATSSRLDLVRVLNDLSHARQDAVDDDSVEHGAQEGRRAVEQGQGETIEAMEARRDTLVRTLVEKHEAFIASAAQLEAARSVTNSITNWVTEYQESIMPYILALDDDDTKAGENVVNAIRAMTEIHTNQVKSLHAEHKRNLGALSSAVRAAKTTMEVSTSMQCCLCLDRMCNRAFVPCGHMLCSICHEKSPRAKNCFTCRSSVTHVLRLFMN